MPNPGSFGYNSVTNWVYFGCVDFAGFVQLRRQVIDVIRYTIWLTRGGTWGCMRGKVNSWGHLQTPDREAPAPLCERQKERAPSSGALSFR